MVPTLDIRGSDVDVAPTAPAATDDHAGTETMGVRVDPADAAGRTTGTPCNAAGEGIEPSGTGGF